MQCNCVYGESRWADIPIPLPFADVLVSSGSMSRRRCLARMEPVFLLFVESQGYIQIIPKAKVVELPSGLLGTPFGRMGKQGKVKGRFGRFLDVGV